MSEAGEKEKKNGGNSEGRNGKIELKLLVDEKNEVVASLDGVDLGFANLIVERLLQEKSVGFAAVDYSHPTQKTLVLRVKAKSPKKAVANALDEIKKELSALKLSKR